MMHTRPPLRLDAQHATLILAPLAACLLVVFVDLSPGHPEVTRTAAAGLLMAAWWISGALPLAATSLLPLVLFPMLGIMDAQAVSAQYFNDTIALYIGGFLMALAMERWNLHRRVALRILLWLGVRPRRLLFGFMFPAFFASMWISNTAAAMMMVPIALSVIARLEEAHPAEDARRYAVGLLLGIAYSASLGGIATPIGTPPNLSLIRIAGITFPDAPEISFAMWMLFACPFSFALLLLLWLQLGARTFHRGEQLRLDVQVLRDQYEHLGRARFEERVVAAAFALLCLLWLTRTGGDFGAFALPGWSQWLPAPEFVRDGSVAILAAFVLFAIPSVSEPGRNVLDWETARRIPWDIVLLFGGGFALATGFAESGLSQWAGGHLSTMSDAGPIALIFAAIAIAALLTQLTSNTATTEMLLPILAATGVATGLNPMALMIPAAIACSLAFTLPASTPPNAVVFGTGHLRVADMVRQGAAFGLLSIFALAAAMLFYGFWVFGIDLGHLPGWAILPPPK